MPQVIKIISTKYGPDKKYAVVTVLTSDGDTADIFVGGEIEVFYHKEKIKAYVKRGKQLDNNSTLK